MKKLILFFLLTGITVFTASAQFFQWAKIEDKISGYDDIKSLACGSGFVATTGIFSKPVTLGNQTFTPVSQLNFNNTYNAYLSIHDQAGNNLWAKHIITYNNIAPSVSVDHQDNIIIAGTFIDSLNIDGSVIKPSIGNTFGFYVAKFSPSGTLLWLRGSDPRLKLLYYENNKIKSAVTDKTGNVFIAGEFDRSLTFNGTTLSSNALNAFMVKYDANGVFQWAKMTPNLTEPLELQVRFWTAPNGNLYLAKFNEDRNPNKPIRYFSMVCFNNNGVKLWDQKINYTYGLYPDLAFDQFNNGYLTGAYYKDITFGKIPLHNASGAQFLAKVDASGNWKWARTIISKSASSPDSTTSIAGTRIFINSTNEIGIAGIYRGTADFKGITLAAPSHPQSFVAKYDTSGTVHWANHVTGTANYVYDLAGDPNGNLYIAGYFLNSNTLQFSITTLTGPSLMGGYYLAKVTSAANTLSGTVYLDENFNAIKDSMERSAENLLLETFPGPMNNVSAPDGSYNFFLQTGNYSVSIVNPPKYYTISPASHSGSFTGIRQTQTGKDFALQPKQNSNDVQVTITEAIRPRPGFTSKYRLTIHNAGTTTLSDTVKFSHNTGTLLFVGASVPPHRQNNGNMAWYYQGLLPNETRHIDLTFSVPVGTVLGTPLTAIASIAPMAIDLYQPDNLDTLQHIVVGSFDPNDKKVDKSEITPAAAATGEFLDYTIRFQNTGTDTAFTVVVSDQLAESLEVKTLEMLAASHPYTLRLIKNSILEWRFNNILLPDSNRNEPGSHGFIRFRIKTKPGLALGDSVRNNAAIYFDLNAPVITNYAVTRVFQPADQIPDGKELNTIKLYPNPARNYVVIETQFKEKTPVKISLVNMLGQTISKITLPADQQLHYKLPLNNLPKGVYIIQLETKTGSQTKRLVIQ